VTNLSTGRLVAVTRLGGCGRARRQARVLRVSRTAAWPVRDGAMGPRSHHARPRIWSRSRASGHQPL